MRDFIVSVTIDSVDSDASLVRWALRAVVARRGDQLPVRLERYANFKFALLSFQKLSPAVFGVHHFVLIVTALLEVGSAERWLRDVVASRWRTTLEGTIQTSISRKAIQWILDWHDHRRCGIPLTCRAHWVAWKWHAEGWYDPDDDARIWMRIMLR